MPDEPMYVSYGNDMKSRNAALQKSGMVGENGFKNAIYHSAARTMFQNIDSPISVREGYSRRDYDYFRPDERVPRDVKGRIKASEEAYKNSGLIRNVVDLMSDFAVKGVKIVCSKKKEQKFMTAWSKKVGLTNRAERFINGLFKRGNVVVKRRIATISRTTDIKAAQTVKQVVPQIPQDKDIPIGYIFINPLCVEVMNEELATFVGKPTYGIRIDPRLLTSIKNPKNEEEKELVKLIPADIKNPKRGEKGLYIPDQNDISVFFYKKEDWEPWADPMLGAILDDIAMLEKMKLCDLSALDGAISHIRIWTIGSLEHKIAPTAAAFNKLNNALLANPGGGTMDLIWDDTLKLNETSTDVHQFLGETKYQPVLNSIYSGLGIPPTLTGTSSASGFTNNFISLKTLVERLSYGRSVLLEFLQAEIAILKQKLGFTGTIEVVFDYDILSDEAAMKALLIQLVDRGIVSEEEVRNRFGTINNIELSRINHEENLRKAGKIPAKAGPWHNPQKDFDMQKIALQSGIIRPSEAGIKTDDEVFNKRLKADTAKPPAPAGVPGAKKKSVTTKPKGRAGQGRPVNKKDSKKRKKKPIKPKTIKGFSRDFIWAQNVQNQIADVLGPLYLTRAGKKNMRQLTNEETDEFETLKFSVLCSFEPYTEVTAELISESINSLSVPEEFFIYRAELIKEVAAGRPISVDEARSIQSIAYSHIASKVYNKDELIEEENEDGED